MSIRNKDHQYLIEAYFSIRNKLLTEQVNYSKMSADELQKAYNTVYSAIRRFRNNDPYVYEYVMKWLSYRDLKSSMSREDDPTCPTFQTNGPSLKWNPAFVKFLNYNEDYVQAIIFHEVLHVLFNHHKRFSFVKDPRIWRNIVNVATDLSINQMIQKTNTKLPTDIGMVFLDNPQLRKMFGPKWDELLPDKDAVYYYKKLIEMMKNEPETPPPPQEPDEPSDSGEGESEKDQDDSEDTSSQDNESDDDSDNSSEDGEPQDEESSEGGESEEQDDGSEEGTEGGGDDGGEDGQEGDGGGVGDDDSTGQDVDGEDGSSGGDTGSDGDESDEGDGSGPGVGEGGIDGSDTPSKSKQSNSKTSGEENYDELNIPDGWEEIVKQVERNGLVDNDPTGETSEDNIKEAEVENKEMLDKVAAKFGGSIGNGFTGYGGFQYKPEMLDSPKKIPWNDILNRFANRAEPQATYAKVPRRRLPSQSFIKKMGNYGESKKLPTFKSFLFENEGIVQKGKGINKVAELCFIVDVSGSMGTTWRTIFKQLKDVFNPDELKVSQNIIIRVLIFSDGIQQELIFTERGSDGLQSSDPKFSTIESISSSMTGNQYVPIRDIHPLPINPDIVGKVGIKSGGGTQLYPVLESLKDRNIPVQMAIIITDGFLFGRDTVITKTSYPYDLIWFITTDKKTYGNYSEPFKSYFMGNSSDTYWLKEYDLDIW